MIYIETLRKAVALKHHKAMYLLADKLIDTDEWSHALEMLREVADAGDLKAQCKLANSYLYKFNNKQLAAKYLKLAAANGDTKSKVLCLLFTDVIKDPLIKYNVMLFKHHPEEQSLMSVLSHLYDREYGDENQRANANEAFEKEKHVLTEGHDVDGKLSKNQVREVLDAPVYRLTQYKYFLFETPKMSYLKAFMLLFDANTATDPVLRHNIEYVLLSEPNTYVRELAFRIGILCDALKGENDIKEAAIEYLTANPLMLLNPESSKGEEVESQILWEAIKKQKSNQRKAKVISYIIVFAILFSFCWLCIYLLDKLFNL